MAEAGRVGTKREAVQGPHDPNPGPECQREVAGPAGAVQGFAEGRASGSVSGGSSQQRLLHPPHLFLAGRLTSRDGERVRREEPVQTKCISASICLPLWSGRLGQNDRSKDTSPGCLLQPVWGTTRTFPSWQGPGGPGQGQYDGITGKSNLVNLGKGRTF